MATSYKIKARSAVYIEVAAGRLTPQPCVAIWWDDRRCGRVPAQAHHEDYSKPLEIVWLCSICHSRRHRELRANPQAPLRIWGTP